MAIRVTFWTMFTVSCFSREDYTYDSTQFCQSRPRAPQCQNSVGQGGDGHTRSTSVEAPTVVAALELASLGHTTGGERRQPVRTPIDERTDGAVETDEYPRFVEHPDADRRVADLLGRGHDVPSASQRRCGVGQRVGQRRGAHGASVADETTYRATAVLPPCEEPFVAERVVSYRRTMRS